MRSFYAETLSLDPASNPFSVWSVYQTGQQPICNQILILATLCCFSFSRSYHKSPEWFISPLKSDHCLQEEKKHTQLSQWAGAVGSKIWLCMKFWRLMASESARARRTTLTLRLPCNIVSGPIECCSGGWKWWGRWWMRKEEGGKEGGRSVRGVGWYKSKTMWGEKDKD